MRVKITFSLPAGSSFPINYNYHLSSLIYHILGQSDSDFASFLHDEGFTFRGKHFKLFTFSQLLFERKKIEKDKIINRGKEISWFISSPKPEFIRHFISGLFNKRQITISNIPVLPERVETIAEPLFNGNNKFTCLSPLTMSTKVERDGKPALHYLSIEEDSFIVKIKENLIKKYQLIFNKLPENTDFDMQFDREYIASNKKISRLIDFKGTKIRGYMIPFTVKGSPELVKTGYECGFGDKNSLGFGMVKPG